MTSCNQYTPILFQKQGGTLMNEPAEGKNRLRVPAGMTAQGPVMDLMEAQAKAMLAIPELLNDIAGSLSVIALYCEKKGLTENLFTEEELEGGNAAV
jgi:hypothetical protein